MVVKTDTCFFTEFKIYPGHGRRLVRKDGKVPQLLGNCSCTVALGLREPESSLSVHSEDQGSTSDLVSTMASSPQEGQG